MAGQEGCDLPFVLLGGKGAGGANEDAPRRQQRRRVFQDLGAQGGAVLHQRFIVLGGGHCLLAEHALPGAGRIHQHPVKTAGPGGGQPGGVLVGDEGVGHPHPLQILAQHFGPRRHILVGHQKTLTLQRRRQLAGLSPWCGAQVRHPHAGLHIQQRKPGRWHWVPGHRTPRHGARDDARDAIPASVVKAAGQNGDASTAKSAWSLSQSGVQRSVLTVMPRAGSGVA